MWPKDRWNDIKKIYILISKNYVFIIENRFSMQQHCGWGDPLPKTGGAEAPLSREAGRFPSPSRGIPPLPPCAPDGRIPSTPWALERGFFFFLLINIF